MPSSRGALAGVARALKAVPSKAGKRDSPVCIFVHPSADRIGWATFSLKRPSKHGVKSPLKNVTGYQKKPATDGTNRADKDER